MSNQVEGKPVGMWTNEELRNYLNALVCTRGKSNDLVVIAEALVRVSEYQEMIERLRVAPKAEGE